MELVIKNLQTAHISISAGLDTNAFQSFRCLAGANTHRNVIVLDSDIRNNRTVRVTYDDATTRTIVICAVEIQGESIQCCATASIGKLDIPRIIIPRRLENR